MTTDWTEIYRHHFERAAFVHIDLFASGTVVGIQRGGDFFQLTEGEELTNDSLRTALSGVDLILAFNGRAVAALLDKHVPKAVLTILDVRELARALDAPSIVAMLDNHFRASSAGNTLWHRARATLLENNRTDTQNLAFFTEQLVRYAQGE
jgi:hypothetical protein